MALLMGAMRAANFTQSTEPVNAWLAGRQWGRWIAPYLPTTPKAPAPDPAAQLRSLEELRDQGVVDETEFQTLRARLNL